jgi:pimeloyl-ACP methyl ester carboxylesterase
LALGEQAEKVLLAFTISSRAAWFFDRKRASAVDETKITCPVLVIAGGWDQATPAPVVRKVANKYRPVSTFKKFVDHSHWVIGEPGWQEIAHYISDWLNHVLR